MSALVDDDVMLGFRFQAMLWFSPPCWVALALCVTAL